MLDPGGLSQATSSPYTIDMDDPLTLKVALGLSIVYRQRLV